MEQIPYLRVYGIATPAASHPPHRHRPSRQTGPWSGSNRPSIHSCHRLKSLSSGVLPPGTAPAPGPCPPAAHACPGPRTLLGFIPSLVDRQTTRCYTDDQPGPDIESQERRETGSRYSYVAEGDRVVNEQSIEARRVHLHNCSTGRSVTFTKATIIGTIAHPE
jgi:hypothetical protein